MARVELQSYSDGVVQTRTGNVVIGASVFVYRHGTTTPVTVYADESSGTLLGQPLTTDNNGRVPGWVDSGQRLDIVVAGITTPLEALDATATSTLGSTVATKTANYTLTTSDEVILADATAEAFTLTLLTAVGFARHYVLKAITTNSNLVTLNTTSSQTVDGNASGALTLGALGSSASHNSMILVSDGANWQVI